MPRIVRRLATQFGAVAVMLGNLGLPAVAQERVTLHTNVTFYGDNTEFFNPFRDGETLFGTAATVAFDVALNDRVTFRGGIFTDHRFGSERFAEQWRPVFSLTVDRGPSRFVIGTLDITPEAGLLGPDLVGPHRLLPPLQRETLAFTRPYEAGLQWKLDGARIEQDAWINWQRLNTNEHRERFDAGLTGRVPLDTPIPMAVAYQVHHVHEGGQLFDTGPVSDSFAGGPGFIVEPPVGLFDRTTVESYMMWSKHVADRAVEDGANHGHGLFVRVAAEKNRWRGHAVFWEAYAWLKVEGDENYGSRLQDGTVFRPTRPYGSRLQDGTVVRPTRHYGELGLTRMLYEDEGVTIEGSIRLHHVEQDYNYSFRVLARVNFDIPLLMR